MQTNLTAMGRIEIKFFENGELVREVRTKNKVLNGGINWLIALMKGGDTRKLNWMLLGSGNRPVASTDIDMANQAAISTVTLSGDGVLYVNAEFGESSGSYTISELGLLLSDQTLIARAVIPAQDKSATTTVAIQWTLSLQAS